MHVAANPAHGRRVLVMALAVLGLAIGIAIVRPQPYSSRDAVMLGPISQASDDALIATSRPVLAGAGRSLGLHSGFASLRPRVIAMAVTHRVIEITAQGANPVAALQTDQAVTQAYLRFRATTLSVMYRDMTRAYRRRHPSGALPSRMARFPKLADETAVLSTLNLLPHTSLLAAGTKSGGIGLAAGLLVASVILIFGAGRKGRQTV